MKGTLSREVRQSLQLIGLSIASMVVYVGLGLLVVRVFA
jgi:hypothetical protein